jgi:DNA-binding GntR family transcriptional regulator
VNSEPENLERVYQYLRQSIVTGDLRAGTRLVEDRISADLHVSRTPVREAIQRLISNGLVTRVRRGQIEVRYVSQIERDQLHLLRLAFDEIAAGLIAEKQNEIDWDRLYAKLDPIGEAVSSKGLKSAELAMAHLELHLAINQAAFEDSVAALIMGQGFLYIIDPAAQPPGHDPMEQHRAMLDDLRSGDKTIAKKALRDHAILKTA